MEIDVQTTAFGKEETQHIQQQQQKQTIQVNCFRRDNVCNENEVVRYTHTHNIKHRRI